MKVKAHIEQTRYAVAEVDLNDDELLAYVNNGGEHDFEDLAAAQAALAPEDFLYILREYVEYEEFDHNPSLTGVTLTDDTEPSVEVNKVEML